MRKFKRQTMICMAICSWMGMQSMAYAGEQERGETEAFTVTTITEVFGDGQKASAVALEYPAEIDASSLAVEDYEIEGKTIAGIFTNSEAGITDSDIPGNYVILKLAYENSESADAMNGGGKEGGQNMPGAMTVDGGELQRGEKSDGEMDRDGGNIDGGMSRDGGNADGAIGRNGGNMDGGMGRDGGTIDGGMLRGAEGAGADLSVAVIQKGEIAAADGTVYEGSEKAVESSEQIDLIVQDFQQLEYTDPETGNTIPYGLYLPADYDETRKYPLLFFVADASANGDDITRNLTQGNGAIVWATPEEQAKHECIILAPQYTNTLIDTIGALTTDENVWSDGLTLVSDLLHYVIDEYSVDETRIYGTGQSQGCMTNIALSDRYPDLFAGQLLVAGQWDVEEMAAMKDKNLWIVVCEGDNKAYPGMNAATEEWEALGSSVARSDMWDSTSTAEEFDELVAQMEAQGCKINYTVFEGGSHTYTWSVAYNIEGIRDWLFAQISG